MYQKSSSQVWCMVKDSWRIQDRKGISQPFLVIQNRDMFAQDTQRKYYLTAPIRFLTEFRSYTEVKKSLISSVLESTVTK